MRAYVLTRRDLNEKQQFVQAMHALAGVCIWYPKIAEQWNNSNLVVLGVKDEAELHFWQQKLYKTMYGKNPSEIPMQMFYEPWYEEDTAVAILDVDGEVEKALKGLPLL